MRTTKRKSLDTDDSDVLVVLSTFVRFQVVLELLGIRGNIGTLGSTEIVGHTRVEGEQRCCSTNLRTHVANGSHAGA